MRNRVTVITVSLLAMSIAATFAWLAMGWLSKKADSSVMFPIESVRFVGEVQRVDAAELKRVAGGIRGSMLQTNLSDVQAAIKQVHWVRNAEVRRRFPATLEVNLEEHRAVAKWQSGESEQRYLVNTFGEVFEADLATSLPLFSGPDGAAKEMLANYETFKSQLALVGQSPAAIALSGRRAWQIRLDNGVVLELGRSEAGERLNRYVKAYAAVPALQLANARIDMRYPSGLALKITDANAVKPATGSAPKAIKKSAVK